MQKRAERAATYSIVFFVTLALYRFARKRLRGTRAGTSPLGTSRHAQRATLLPREGRSDDSLSTIASARKYMLAAFERGDIDAYLAAFALDATVLSTMGSRISGRCGLRVALEESRDIVRDVRVAIEHLEIVMLGDVALETGSYEAVIGSSTTKSAGRFTAVWKRDDEQWKIVFEAVRAKS